MGTVDRRVEREEERRGYSTDHADVEVVGLAVEADRQHKVARLAGAAADEKAAGPDE